MTALNIGMRPIITDNQGSVRLVISKETNLDFKGGLYDPDTGLVNFRMRWYDVVGHRVRHDCHSKLPQ